MCPAGESGYPIRGGGTVITGIVRIHIMDIRMNTRINTDGEDLPITVDPIKARKRGLDKPYESFNLVNMSKPDQRILWMTLSITVHLNARVLFNPLAFLKWFSYFFTVCDHSSPTS
jgi:hypothetical protein